MNIAAALAEKARLEPDRTAITFLKTGAALTFRQLTKDIDGFLFCRTDKPAGIHDQYICMRWIINRMIAIAYKKLCH